MGLFSSAYGNTEVNFPFNRPNTLPTNGEIFVFLNGQLLFDSYFYGKPFSSDYDIIGDKIQINQKSRQCDTLQVACPALHFRWIYQFDQGNWILLSNLKC